jgi:hypothetical protein
VLLEKAVWVQLVETSLLLDSQHQMADGMPPAWAVWVQLVETSLVLGSHHRMADGMPRTVQHLQVVALLKVQMAWLARQTAAAKQQIAFLAALAAEVALLLGLLLGWYPTPLQAPVASLMVHSKRKHWRLLAVATAAVHQRTVDAGSRYQAVAHPCWTLHLASAIQAAAASAIQAVVAAP